MKHELLIYPYTNKLTVESLQSINPSTRIRRNPQSLNKSENRVEEEYEEENLKIKHN